MKSFDQHTLQTLYPAMTADFASRAEALIRSLPTAEEEAPMKRFSVRTAVIVLTIAALMTTSALALIRPAVLDWLLGVGGQANEQLSSIVQNTYGEVTADGITARVTSAVFDGMTLVFAYELENSDPAQAALVAFDPTIRIGGEDVRLLHISASQTNQTLVPSPHLDILPVQRNPVHGGGETSHIRQPLTGTVDCELTMRVFRPEKAFAYLIAPEDSMLAAPNALDDDARAEAEDVLNTLRSMDNLTLVPPSEADPAHWTAEGFTVLGSASDTDPQHLLETACVTLRFPIDASHFIAYDFSDMADTSLADCTVHVRKLRLSPLKTLVELVLIPTENTEDAAASLVDRYGPLTLMDEAGQPVTYSDMDYMYCNTPWISQSNAQWVCLYSLDMPGLLTFPASLHLQTNVGDILQVDLAE